MNDIEADSYQWDTPRDSKAPDLKPYAELVKALAEKDREIAQLRNEVALLKADDAEGCELIRDMEDEERRKDAVIEEQAQEIARLREALKEMVKAYNQLLPGIAKIAVQDYANINEAPILAQQALKETVT